ncbi:Hypothetical protein NTJ_03787 [Nesidiocoris tenuis]|uniref:Uncharacterized protein n=1 Tax=Nesidiocoris tenuis TaxID=355587 RepID=A0ABN7AHX7_9HEMI|nr:Hypothetical protein NTJ_03787 [Nesidiocoris tenuis]
MFRFWGMFAGARNTPGGRLSRKRHASFDDNNARVSSLFSKGAPIKVRAKIDEEDGRREKKKKKKKGISSRRGSLSPSTSERKEEQVLFLNRDPADQLGNLSRELLQIRRALYRLAGGKKRARESRLSIGNVSCPFSAEQETT